LEGLFFFFGSGLFFLFFFVGVDFFERRDWRSLIDLLFRTVGPNVQKSPPGFLFGAPVRAVLIDGGAEELLSGSGGGSGMISTASSTHSFEG
jgi:hypothetical protein